MKKLSNLMAATVAVASVGATGIASAAGSSRSVGWALSADLDVGGDDLVTIGFTDGSTQDISAGQGITLAGGMYMRPNVDSPLVLRGMVGYKFATTTAENADIGISRVVLELMSNYEFNQDWYGGIGLVRHMGTEVDGDGFFSNVGFDDSTGVSGELGWRFLAVHYTKMDYTDEFGGEWDASHFGFRFAYKF